MNKKEKQILNETLTSYLYDISRGYEEESNLNKMYGLLKFLWNLNILSSNNELILKNSLNMLIGAEENHKYDIYLDIKEDLEYIFTLF